MKKALVLWWTCMLTCAAFAQNAGKVRYEAVCEGLTKHAVTTGDFTQIKRSEAIKRELKSAGTFIFTKEGVVWNTQRPFSSVVTVTQDSIIQIAPDGTKSVIDGSNNQVFAQIAAMLSALFSGDRKALEENFHVSFLNAPNSWKMILTPRDSTIVATMKTVTLGGRGSSADDISLDSIVIAEAHDNSITYSLRNHIYKKGLSDEEWAYFTKE